MKRANKTIVAVVIVVALVAGVSCAPKPREQEARSEITVTDAVGREVTLPYPVNSLIVTDDNQAEFVRLMGAEDKVVGISRDIRARGYFPEMSDEPATGQQWRGLNYEKIAEVNPDAVLELAFWHRGWHEEATKRVEKLRKIGVKTICINTFPSEKAAESIQLLGKILGREERAQRFLDWREDKLSMLEERLKGAEQERPQVLFLHTRGGVGKGLHVCGAEYVMNPCFVKAGLRNGVEGNPKKVSSEWVLAHDPDVDIIILGDWSAAATGYEITQPSKPQEFIEAFRDKTVLGEMTAAKEGRMYAMSYMLAGTRNIGLIGSLYLAKAAYPDRFEDVNPEAIHEEYFEKWLRLDYQGIWFYPQPWSK